jgi:hypothetical protein
MLCPGVADTSSSSLTQDLQAAVESLALFPSSSLPCTAVSGGEDETTHDYAEIYTPSHERVPWLGAGNASLSNHRDASQGSTFILSVEFLMQCTCSVCYCLTLVAD